MTMTVTTINYSDIDLAILRECFEKSKPYMEAEKPNIIWEEFGLTRESTDDEKFEKLREYFENASLIFKLDIDGRIVNYGMGFREVEGTGMFSHSLDLIREDASGSQGWTYVTEYNQKIDAWYKSVSDNNPESSLWIVEGSSMEKAYNDCVSAAFDDVGKAAGTALWVIIVCIIAGVCACIICCVCIFRAMNKKSETVVVVAGN